MNSLSVLGADMVSTDFLGRVVWIEMDTDRSAVNFSPRKGIVTKVFRKCS